MMDMPKLSSYILNSTQIKGRCDKENVLNIANTDFKRLGKENVRLIPKFKCHLLNIRAAVTAPISHLPFILILYFRERVRE